MFTAQDLRQLDSLGISINTIERQMEYFRKGFPFIDLDRPATIGDGIIQCSETDKNFYINYFDKNSSAHSIRKFVPASGAASRMFKNLFEFRESYINSETGYQNYLKDKSFNSIYQFIENLRKFAFYSDLVLAVHSAGAEIEALRDHKEFGRIIHFLLSDEGLGYSSLPKALLKFHFYEDGSRVAFEEHLVEAALYANDGKGSARLHFTLSPEHIGKFRQKLDEVTEKYRNRFKIDFDVTFSIQERSTDTIAADENNEPFRNPGGDLLFRPGGHGALIRNLNNIDSDIIFIKNIDNIVPDRLKGPTVEYKKLIGGYLLFVRSFIFGFLSKSETGILTEEDLTEVTTFMKDKLFMEIPQGFSTLSFDERIKHLVTALDRPIRVCGMVKNEGEPGGGPFWVKDQEGKKSLQIVESSQVDPGNPHQKNILTISTHFNPVDLVCSTRDYKGRTFDLADFTDPDTGFIALKSSGGKVLKAQELPGLWNGAMAKWITIFIDVPLITFNPVKTVNDLLRKEHQP